MSNRDKTSPDRQAPDRQAPNRQAEVQRILASALGEGAHSGGFGWKSQAIDTSDAGAEIYQSDAFTLAHGKPLATVFPRTTAEVSRVVRALTAAGIPIVTRGSGTGLAGGAAAMSDETDAPRPVLGRPATTGNRPVVLLTTRMNHVFSIDAASRTAHVQAGVLNVALSDLLALNPETAHLHFAPDPSSGRASTLGGNAATNAGGVHTLKDFVTSNHVMGVTAVLSDGEVITTGGRNGTTSPGPFDLTALLCGSEGTLGIITELHLRLSVKREVWRTVLALFDSTAAACSAVSDIVADGILPAAMEMMDGTMIRVIEDAYQFGIPPATRAMLVIELDGTEPALVDAELQQVLTHLHHNAATEVRGATTPEERAKLWKARKSAFGAIGKLSHSYCTQDACVPRSRLGEMLAATARVGEKYGITISNVFHAGDGNIHPIFLYDDRDPAQVDNALAACAEVLQAAIDIGGTITGEHGVGVEKVALMPYLFDRATLAAFQNIRSAFDPTDLLNPGKLLPSTRHDYAIIRPRRTAQNRDSAPYSSESPPNGS